MRVLSYSISPRFGGLTVREYSKKELGLSSHFLTEQRKIPRGILINGEPARTVDILSPGDELTFRLPIEETQYPKAGLPIEIAYEDEDFLIVNKPSGMPVHPSPGHDSDSLLNAVASFYERTGQAHIFRPVYRLDRDTSGLIAIAKNLAASCSVKTQKTYFAICEGRLNGEGSIDEPIGLSEDSRILRIQGRGDAAVTHWKSLASFEGYSLVQLNLETGRTHQIRVHMSSLGFPIAGDDLYGGGTERISRQALHCGRLRLSSKALPQFGEKTFISAFPDDMTKAFPKLKEIEI